MVTTANSSAAAATASSRPAPSRSWFPRPIAAGFRQAGRQIRGSEEPTASNSGPVKVFSLPPKAPRADGGSTTAQFVAPKADRGNSSGPQDVFSMLAKGSAGRQRLNHRSDRGAEGPARRRTGRCHGRAAEVRRSATARARIRRNTRSRSSRPFLLRLPSRPRLRRRWWRARRPRRLRPRPRRKRPRSRACLHPRRPALRLRATMKAAIENYDQGYDDGYTGGSYGDDGCY
mgnify:CR=1 FL=1